MAFAIYGARALLVVAAATLSLVLGCSEPAEVAEYTAPRAEPPARPVEVETVRAALDHMLVAVVPQGDQAWFFKLVAPAADAADLKPAFDDFVKSVELPTAGEKPAWKLPDGWSERDGGAPMRAATIEIPGEKGQLELTVSTLPYAPPREKFLKENVRRWLGQLGEARIDDVEIEKLVALGRTLPLKGGEATAYEFVGVMQQSAGPMMGAMPPGHPELPAAGEQPMPESTVPPARAATDAAPPASAGFQAQLPEGWKAGPARPMRKATYIIGGEHGQAELAVTAFPAVPMMADPLANARRWAGELQQTALSDDDLAATLSDRQIAGVASKVFELSAPGEGGDATLAAMAPRGDQIWFFKLKGARPTVESQRAAFDEFLKSVKFAEK